MQAYTNVFSERIDTSQEGMLSVKRLFDSSKMDGSAVSRCATNVITNRLELLITSDVDEIDRERILPKALGTVKSNYAVVCVDLGGGILSESKQQIVNNSDLVVVCLPQNPKTVSACLELINSTVKDKKTLFIVGRYEAGSALTVTKIATVSGRKTKDVLVIPSAISYMDALGRENVFDFFQRAISTKKSFMKMSEDELCVHRIREVNTAILSKLDLPLDREDGK